MANIKFVSKKTMDYIICTRGIRNGEFTNEPGKATYLQVPDKAKKMLPEHKTGVADFLRSIINSQNEDIAIYVHGYNMTNEETLFRHRVLKNGLAKQGFTGDLLTFAWPSGKNPILYLEDRHDAKNVAMELVNSGIKLLARQQGKNCTINVHLIAHSTGAFIVNEAFDDSETTQETAEINWSVAQILFVGADVSSDSMSSERAQSIYRHCNRLTNYWSPYDSALAISNVKRVGAKNRVGRIGLPENVPGKAVDVDCGPYYEKNKNKLKVTEGHHSHSWHFYSDVWLKDAYETMMLNIDRNVISTREISEGELRLKG
jgi:esterase/lipase superfamily enzyme